jgi:hypothetical protein
MILSKGLPLPPRSEAASSQACALVSLNDPCQVGRLLAACGVPSVESCVSLSRGWCVAWSLERVVEWLRSAEAAVASAPEQLIAAERESAYL